MRWEIVETSLLLRAGFFALGLSSCIREVLQSGLGSLSDGRRPLVHGSVGPPMQV